MTDLEDPHDEPLDWYAIVISLVIAVLAGLYALGSMGGLWRRHEHECRFCDLPVECQRTSCQADTHSHGICADIFNAGVERGRELEQLEYDGDADELEEATPDG